MKNIEESVKWLKRAKSNLIRAKIGRTTEDVFYEDLCFDAQQSVEKSLKALLIYNLIPYPKSHNISYLIELLEKNNIKVQKNIKRSVILSNYSIEARYPGDYDEVQEKEFKEAIKIAEDVYNWVFKKINK